MGRSGYSEDGDCDNPSYLLWPSIVERSIKGRRGQTFLKALAAEMDAMPVKRLIAGELVTAEGECCTMGVVCKARGIDASQIDYTDRERVGKLFNIAPALAGEIAYMNDDDFDHEARHASQANGKAFDSKVGETPEERWVRMRAWVDEQLKGKEP